SRRRHTRFSRDWSSDVCSSDLSLGALETESFQDIRHLQYFASGVEIVYDINDKKLASIFLLAPNYSKWYKPYVGELPFGLNWNKIGRASCRETMIVEVILVLMR